MNHVTNVAANLMENKGELSKEELQKIVDENERYNYYTEKFSLKWVEKVVFWAIVTFAAAVFGVITTNILEKFLHKP